MLASCSFKNNTRKKFLNAIVFKRFSFGNMKLLYQNQEYLHDLKHILNENFVTLLDTVQRLSTTRNFINQSAIKLLVQNVNTRK